MSDVRKLVALVIVALGLGAAVFGAVRGLSATGPAHGTRMIVMIDPPLDADVVAKAQHAVTERLAGKAAQLRVMPAGDRLVVETADEDPRIVGEQVARVEQAGGGHALHVASRTPFTRATGFWPRAWPFFAAAGVLLAIAALLARRRQPA